jgi:PhoH-like ATPase
MSVEKHYLLDTSVILDDALNALRLYDHGNNAIYITNIVLAEMNNRKEDIRSEAGFRAREFFRLADNELGEPIKRKDLPDFKDVDNKLFSEDKYYKMILQYSVGEGEDINDVTIPLYVIHRPLYRAAQSYKEPQGLNDAKIGEIALDYGWTLVTNDIAFKIAASIEGVPSQTLRHSQVNDPDDIAFEYELTYSEDKPIVQEVDLLNFTQVTCKELATSESGEEYETGIVKYALAINGALDMMDFDLRFGDHFDTSLVRPINLEQKFYYATLTHPMNSVTVVTGSTGSGKTLVALQAGLEMLKDGVVEGIVYARNTITSNDQQAELGFRKGDEHQKLGYFMYPLYSAVNYTIEQMKEHSFDPHVEFSGDTNSIKEENATMAFMEKYNIEVMDLAHLRGTTISKKFVIIDEGQNMTHATLKLVGTRMGEGTKLAVLGDFHQIDHPFLSKRRNALVALLQKAQKDHFVAGITLKHTIRSQTADWFDSNF